MIISLELCFSHTIYVGVRAADFTSFMFLCTDEHTYLMVMSRPFILTKKRGFECSMLQCCLCPCQAYLIGPEVVFVLLGSFTFLFQYLLWLFWYWQSWFDSCSICSSKAFLLWLVGSIRMKTTFSLRPQHSSASCSL